MTVIRVVADDLTGALDAAAPFALRHGPLPVLWRLDDLDRRSFAFDTESRTRRRVDWPACWRASVDGAELIFKKIDSLLRDRTVDEITACWQSGLFTSAVIAPAFPAQHRITRSGRQYWRAGSREAWQPVRCDLVAMLRARGVPVQLAASASTLPMRGIVLCDATSHDDLAALVGASARLARPLLWCGTAGLAHALAGVEPAPGTFATPPIPAPLLILTGTRHAVTLRQVDRLAARYPALIGRLDSPEPGAIDRTLAAVKARLTAGGNAALIFDLPPRTAPEIAGRALTTTCSTLVDRLPRPASLAVTGGSTLFRLVRALAATALRVEGQLQPGLPRSEIEGGPWSGTVVISKSGAFGHPEILAELAGSVQQGRNGEQD